jgi:DMSO/TMAO reductase YedYZ molybdopterin-dependent catalytic subunit
LHGRRSLRGNGGLFFPQHKEEEAVKTAKRVSVLAIVLLGVALAACGGNAPKVDWSIEINGAVSQPLTLTYAELAKREQVTLENVLMRRSQGEDTTNTWVGPDLAAILQEAGISDGATGITAFAADGYAMSMTMEDIKGAIIALQVDGEWIAEDEDHGPIRIVAPEKPANHWLFQLTTITVEE